MPQSTDLVTDLPADFEVFGQAVATSMADLLGGTTGQVLSKASNTDMDFTWVAQDDSNAIQNAIVDAKGDLIGATAADTPARLAVGTNGQVLTADSTAATGLAWASPVSSTVNLLLNSNFALNQRAYVSAANLASGNYGFDRWKSNFTNTTLTFTASTQGQSLTINSGGGLQQVIEQGLVPAGTYTLSWTGTATGRVYNSGGTPPAYAASPVTFTADGTANVVVEYTAVSTTKTLSKVQFNAGTNTTWSLSTPTLQTELAACQRYFRIANYGILGVSNVTTAQLGIYHPSMRSAPTLAAPSAISITDMVAADFTQSVAGVSSVASNADSTRFSMGAFTGLTPYRTIMMNSATGITMSAEL
jgi:hypothetical protein